MTLDSGTVIIVVVLTIIAVIDFVFTLYKRKK